LEHMSALLAWLLLWAPEPASQPASQPLSLDEEMLLDLEFIEFLEMEADAPWCTE
jgi:hypothetical protein